MDPVVSVRTPRCYGGAFSTPAEIEIGGRSHLAVFNSEGLAILERATGSELAFLAWNSGSPLNTLNTATPLVFGQRIFVSADHRRGCGLIDFASGEPEVLWSSRGMRSQSTGCVLWEEHFYGFDRATLKCIDLKGEEKWEQRGLGQGCMSIAGGKILAMSDEGELVIASASPEGYQELARKKVLDGGLYYTTPVLLDGLVYCRNSNGDLVCLDHRGADD